MASNIDYNIENIHISRSELAKISVAKLRMFHWGVYRMLETTNLQHKFEETTVQIYGNRDVLITFEVKFGESFPLVNWRQATCCNVISHDAEITLVFQPGFIPNSRLHKVRSSLRANMNVLASFVSSYWQNYSTLHSLIDLVEEWWERLILIKMTGHNTSSFWD